MSRLLWPISAVGSSRRIDQISSSHDHLVQSRSPIAAAELDSPIGIPQPSGSSPPPYFAFARTPALTPTESPYKSAHRARSLPNLARAWTNKSSRTGAMDGQHQQSQQGTGQDRKQKSTMGFSSLFGKGSTSSRTKGPPAALALSDFVRPHPAPHVPTGRRRGGELRRREGDPLSNTLHIADRAQPSPPPPTPHSAFLATFPQRQREQVEHSAGVQEDFYASLPVSAPHYRRYDGQRSEMRQPRSDEAEVHSQDDLEGSFGGTSSTQGTSAPFATAATPPPSVQSRPLQLTASPLEPMPPATRPNLASAFSADTAMISIADSVISPDSRLSVVSASPSLRPPAAALASSASTEGVEYLATPSDPPTNLPSRFTTFESDNSLAPSSFRGFGGSSEDMHAPRLFDSTSFSQVLDRTIGSIDLRSLSGFAISSRESGGLEEHEGEAEWPWSGSGSLSGDARSAEGGRRREDPLSSADWHELERLVAERDSTFDGMGSGDSGSSTRSKRHAIYISSTSSLPELGNTADALDSLARRDHPDRANHSSDPSSGSASCSDSSRHPQPSPDFKDILGHRRFGEPPPSPSRSMHAPRSPGVQTLQLLRRSLQNSPLGASGISRATESTPQHGLRARAAKLPRQQGRRGLDRLATVKADESGSLPRKIEGSATVQRVHRGPLVRRRSASAPEAVTNRVNTPPQTTTRWTQTESIDSSIYPSSSPSTSGSRWSFHGDRSNSTGSLDTHPQPVTPSRSSHRHTSHFNDLAMAVRPALDHLDTGLDSVLHPSAVQSAEVVEVRSPVGSPIVGMSRAEPRSMARASLIPLGGTLLFGAGVAGGAKATEGKELNVTEEQSELERLRSRNKELEEEVAHLRTRCEGRRAGE